MKKIVDNPRGSRAHLISFMRIIRTYIMHKRILLYLRPFVLTCPCKRGVYAVKKNRKTKNKNVEINKYTYITTQTVAATLSPDVSSSSSSSSLIEGIDGHTLHGSFFFYFCDDCALVCVWMYSTCQCVYSYACLNSVRTYDVN